MQEEEAVEEAEKSVGDIWDFYIQEEQGSGKKRLLEGLPFPHTYPYYVVDYCNSATAASSGAGKDQQQKEGMDVCATIRVGYIGLCTVDTPAMAYPEESVQFMDEISVAKRTVKHLREVIGVDMVVAFTHMWMKNDVDLARAVPGINLM